jgi:putative membrane protein
MAVFFKRALISAIGVALGSWMLPGIHYESAGVLILVVFLLGAFSAVLKPLLVLFTLPFVVMTMGLGLLIINAFLFLFAGYLVEGFYVDGFGYAFFGALIISILNLFFNNWINGGRSYARVKFSRGPRPRGVMPDGAKRQSPAQRRAIGKDDIIDI